MRYTDIQISGYTYIHLAWQFIVWGKRIMPVEQSERFAFILFVVVVMSLVFVAFPAPEVFADWGSDLAGKIDEGRGWATTIGWAIISVTAVILIIMFVLGQRPFMWLGMWFVSAFALTTIDVLIDAIK